MKKKETGTGGVEVKRIVRQSELPIEQPNDISNQASALLENVERALTKINEAEGYFLLGKISSGKKMLGDGKAILEKIVDA